MLDTSKKDRGRGRCFIRSTGRLSLLRRAPVPIYRGSASSRECADIEVRPEDTLIEGEVAQKTLCTSSMPMEIPEESTTIYPESEEKTGSREGSG